MIADNKLGEKADWNTDQLSDLLTGLKEQGEDLDVLGFEDHELDELLEDLDFEQESLEDFAEDDLDFVYQIMIENLTEKTQAELMEKLEAEGLKCRALIV
jgi:GH35 family endo-1,4-beta-xylanase